MKTILVDNDVLQFLLANAAELNEPPSRILRRLLHLDPPPNALDIDDDVYGFLVQRATSLTESASSILRRELHLDSPVQPPSPPVTGPSIVEFHILAGTGDSPWNTPTTAVLAHVGDTLRIFNNDSVAHRLHTNGPAAGPFPHQENDIGSGQSADFALNSLYTGPPLYDHNFGPAAQFWIRVDS